MNTHKSTNTPEATADPAPRKRPVRLTRRQLDVLRMAGRGETTEQIARALDLTMPGVAERVKRLRFNLGAVNRIHAFALAWNTEPSLRTAPSGKAPDLTDREVLVVRIWSAGGTRKDVERLLHITTDAAKALETQVLRATSAPKAVVAVHTGLEHRLISGTDTLASLAAEIPQSPSEAESTGDRPAGPGARPARASIPSAAPTGHLANQLRTTNGLIVHLDTMADMPPPTSLAEILNGTLAVQRAPHVVGRLVHQALARGIPCALVIPPTATDPARTAEAAGLGSAWSAACHQTAEDGTTAYAKVALDLGLQPDTCVVVCTAGEARHALEAGPQKLLVTTEKSALVRAAEPPLTWRERQIAEQCALGRTDEQIGAELKVSQFVVSNDLASMRRKFGVRDRVQVVAHAIRSGLVDTAGLHETVPNEIGLLDDAERAVLQLVATRALDAAGAREIGLTYREARNAHLRAVKKLSPQNSRTHAMTVALLSGALDDSRLAPKGAVSL
ncbi:regulatory protein, luxR family [Streptomyces sp. TLI_053]|uniref:helix-turn-helix domain-containing protein n=1 Tax=Streptomyces sp. TLI_053 TaxID=1855352 RepID=UPI0008799077|nr:helix-turn-helix transcriptional regulator [Streptomyces sp. TLI_053]SDT82703.1 regulatory protein, luxR family [Streptomyces sp. TLI_053]